MNEKRLIELALERGFDHASIIDVDDLVIVPEYRRYCEQNLCGNYDKLMACPPASGTVEEMVANARSFQRALILQTEDDHGPEGSKQAKKEHNIRTEELIRAMKEEGMREYLMMGAGPWKRHSCLSAYSVDAQKMAEKAGMVCWADDGLTRYFSLILFEER